MRGTYRIGLTAFGIFLTALFTEFPLYLKAYLRTLDDFFNAGADVHAAAKTIAWAVDNQSRLDLNRRRPSNDLNCKRGSATVLEMFCYCLRYCGESVGRIMDWRDEDAADRRESRRAVLFRLAVEKVLARKEVERQPGARRALWVAIYGWMDPVAVAEVFNSPNAAASIGKRERGLDVECERNPRPRSPGARARGRDDGSNRLLGAPSSALSALETPPRG